MIIHTYHVQGMMCAGCAGKTQRTLKEIPDQLLEYSLNRNYKRVFLSRCGYGKSLQPSCILV